MSTIKEVMYKQKLEKLEPKLRELIKRIGRIDHIHQSRLVKIYGQFNAGKQISENDIDFITRLNP